MHGQSSFGAYTTPESYAVLMDPENAGDFPMPRTRLFVESLRAIQLARLSPLETLRCMRAFWNGWGPRYWRVVAGELRRRLRYALGLKPLPRHPYQPRARRRPPNERRPR